MTLIRFLLLISAGDDCVSIEDGTHGLHVTRLVCGPGHGISIGSLGDDNSRAEVSDIFIDTVHLYGTTNGARIKTWQVNILLSSCRDLCELTTKFSSNLLYFK